MTCDVAMTCVQPPLALRGIFQKAARVNFVISVWAYSACATATCAFCVVRENYESAKEMQVTDTVATMCALEGYVR